MFSKLIKIPGKLWFDDLTPEEIGLMIDSFLNDGNEYFDALAFNDFLHAKLNNNTLIEIKQELNENAFLDNPNGWPSINTKYLMTLSKKLKSRGNL